MNTILKNFQEIYGRIKQHTSANLLAVQASGYIAVDGTRSFKLK